MASYILDEAEQKSEYDKLVVNGVIAKTVFFLTTITKGEVLDPETRPLRARSYSLKPLLSFRVPRTVHTRLFI